MRRVVSVWLPTWATDRIRANASADGTPPPPEPLVTAVRDNQRMVIAATDAAACRLGLHPGLPVTEARARIPTLTVLPATPEEDGAGLRRLSGWTVRYTPLAAPDSPDGLWLETTGCDHLFGGETELLEALLKRLTAAGFAARAAVADTPGAAWALARFAQEPLVVLPPGPTEHAIAPLPLAALRIDAEAIDTFERLGIERIGQLCRLPRAPLTRRFTAAVLRRLDQALGRIPEPIEPVLPPATIVARLAFAEPLLTAEALATAIGRLTTRLCVRLEKAGRGARRLDLLFDRVDGTIQVLRIGTAGPNRNPAHLARLLRERLEVVDPGLGIEAMRLVASLTERTIPEQLTTLALDRLAGIDGLVDVLSNRLGPGRVYRVEPVESDVPERSVRRTPALAPASNKEWPLWPRPVRLFTPPQPVDALALLPDHPPVAFTWRRKRFRVYRADGPERIRGEWWQSDAEMHSIRDYWRIEDTEGRRFWLYRSGDGNDSKTGDLRWYLHGMF
ncbi:MAG: DNA polymerase Y family protein [Acetobacteraceae bacterium]|nr:DNA polymerase Y family protein [Acetobacteraceae bacterium]